MSKVLICQKCLQDISDIARPDRHLDECCFDEETALKCPQCNKLFPNKSRMNDHIKRTHGEGKHPCSICQYKYKNKDDAEGCFNRHNNDKKHKCTICPRGHFNLKRWRECVKRCTAKKNKAMKRIESRSKALQESECDEHSSEEKHEFISEPLKKTKQNNNNNEGIQSEEEECHHDQTVDDNNNEEEIEGNEDENDSPNVITKMSELEQFIRTAKQMNYHLNVDKMLKSCKNCFDFDVFDMERWKDSNCKILCSLYERIRKRPSAKRKHFDDESPKLRKKRKKSHRPKTLKIKIGADAHKFEICQLMNLPYFAQKMDKTRKPFIDRKYRRFKSDKFDLADFENLIEFAAEHMLLYHISEMDDFESFIHCADAFGLKLKTKEMIKLCKGCHDFEAFDVDLWKDSNCQILCRLHYKMTKRTPPKRRVERTLKQKNSMTELNSDDDIEMKWTNFCQDGGDKDAQNATPMDDNDEGEGSEEDDEESVGHEDEEATVDDEEEISVGDGAEGKVGDEGEENEDEEEEEEEDEDAEEEEEENEDEDEEESVGDEDEENVGDGDERNVGDEDEENEDEEEEEEEDDEDEEEEEEEHSDEKEQDNVGDEDEENEDEEEENSDEDEEDHGGDENEENVGDEAKNEDEEEEQNVGDEGTTIWYTAYTQKNQNMKKEEFGTLTLHGNVLILRNLRNSVVLRYKIKENDGAKMIKFLNRYKRSRKSIEQNGVRMRMLHATEVNRIRAESNQRYELQTHERFAMEQQRLRQERIEFGRRVLQKNQQRIENLFDENDQLTEKLVSTQTQMFNDHRQSLFAMGETHEKIDALQSMMKRHIKETEEKRKKKKKYKKRCPRIHKKHGTGLRIYKVYNSTNIFPN